MRRREEAKKRRSEEAKTKTNRVSMSVNYQVEIEIKCDLARHKVMRGDRRSALTNSSFLCGEKD